jgi:hypothetical protein
VYIELEGFQFEAFTSVLLTGNGRPRLTVKLPREWAQKLELVERSQEEKEPRPITRRGFGLSDAGTTGASG